MTTVCQPARDSFDRPLAVVRPAPARPGAAGNERTASGGFGRLVFPTLVALTLAACAANPALERSREDFEAGDPVAALVRLEQAIKDDPRNVELRTYYFRQRDQLVREKLTAAERALNARLLAEAAQYYREAQAIDPANARARLGLEEVGRQRRRAQRLERARQALAANDESGARRLVRGVLAEAPGDRDARELLRELDERAERNRVPQARALTGAMARPVTLEFRDAPLRVVFEALSHASGLNFVFDRDVRADARVTLFVRDTSVDEVLRLLAATQGIERKLLNANSVLVYPATTAKQREHVDLVTRSFYLANAEAKSAQTMLKQLVKSRDVFIDEKLNLLVLKDTPDAVRMAERLIATLDVPEPEVMLEVEVLEVSRSKLLDLGVDFPDEIGYGLLTPTVEGPTTIIDNTIISGTTQFGGRLLEGNVNLEDTGDLVPFVSNPAAILRLRSEDGDSSMLANPRIRVRNRDKARIHIGDKLPVFTTTSTANVGVSSSVAYLDVGLKLEVEPSIYRDDEVGIKLNLEVSSIVKEVPGPSSSLAYQIGTRSAATTLRLKDGETQVLAGLINDEDRRAAQRFPGLGDLPLLGRLFSAQRDSNSKTEIALLITPRILRNVMPPVALLAEAPAGTGSSIGAEPLRLAPTAPGALGLVGEGGVGGAATGFAAPEAPPFEHDEMQAEPFERDDSGEPGDVSRETPSANAAAPDVALNVPPIVNPGDTATAIVSLQRLGNAQEGELTLVYDAARLEVAGTPTPGRVSLPFGIVDGAAEVIIDLRAKPDASGVATLVVGDLTLSGGGEDRAVPRSVGATVRIGE